jgi:hypothetical protein
MILARWFRTLVVSLILVITVAPPSACASPHGRIYVAVAPPPPIVEAAIVAPGPGYVWIPGYYIWNGVAYVWTPGYWARPPHRGARWVPPRWVHDPKLGWFFIEGHWR